MAMNSLIVNRQSLIGKFSFTNDLLFAIHNKGKAAGFTLIELLIVLFVLSILGLVSAQLFSSILKGTNKASVVAEVKQNGQFLTDTLERHIRAATDVCDADSSDGCVGTFGKIFLITAAGSETIEFQPSCLPPCSPTANGQILLNGAPITNTHPVTGVDVASATFSISETEGSPKVVQVDITLNQGVAAATRQDFQANVKLGNTFSLRTY